MEDHPAYELLEQAPDVVDAIRSQNWKNGGVLSIDREDAVAVIQQLIRTAYSKGAADGSREMGDRLMQTADAVLAQHKPSAVIT